MYSMNFWHMQLHPDDRGRISPQIIANILNDVGVIGLGDWEEGETQRTQFIQEMRIGDIVAIKNGQMLQAIVRVTSDAYIADTVNEDLDWFRHRRRVDVLEILPPGSNLMIQQPRGTISICRDLNTETSLVIINWYQRIMGNLEKSKIVDLLKIKYQIILQGPPGTGKTRLAKQVAEELTKPSNIGSPQEKIDNFFKTFDPKDSNAQTKRKELDSLLNEFKTEFPIDSLKNLTLSNYCIGTGSNDSFCWWIERGLQPVGYYFPGSARSYLLFWNKEKRDYSKHGKLLHDISDNTEAMKLLAKTISDFVISKDFNTASAYLGDSFLLKLLHSYYPSEYSPINSVPCLNNVLKLIGIDYKNLNPVEKNLKVQEYFEKKNKQHSSKATNLEFMKFLFDNFDLKGKISVQSSSLIVEGEYKIIQFHPAYSYEDFVRGISAKTNNSGQIYYEVENKVVAEFAKKALDNPSANYVLIIDEINRANLPSVLGELIYALEYRFDEDDISTTVESMYSLKNEDNEEGSKTLKLPKNLFIIGTMNMADRSIGHIDYAIRRRFSFVDVLPNIQPIKECGRSLFKQVSELFIKDFDTFNWSEPKMVRSEFLAIDFKPEDIWLGHSYFITKNDGVEGTKELEIKLKYDIRPILKEYVKDGILSDQALDVIDQLHV